MSAVQERSGGVVEPRPIVPNVYPILHAPARDRAGEFPVERAAAAFRGFLESLGLDLGDPNLVGTEHRVARAYQEMLGGLRRAEPKLSTFPNAKKYAGMVSVTLSGARVRGVLLWNTWGQVDAARALIGGPGPFLAGDLIGRLPS